LYVKKTVRGKRNYSLKLNSFLLGEYYDEIIHDLCTLKQFLVDTALFDQLDQIIDSNNMIVKDNIVDIEKLEELLNKLAEIDNILDKIQSEVKDLLPEHLISLPKTKELTKKSRNQQKTYISNLYNAEKLLSKMIPRFLLFTDADRDLKTQFNLGEYPNNKPNKALDNLLKIANIDIDLLHKEINSDSNTDEAHSEINRANKILEKFYKEKWAQSKLFVSLRLEGTTLYIKIENEELDVFDLRQRSDGLRQFIALINFVEAFKSKEENIILLVDEAELHLHYDAQVDLIKNFHEQTFAAKIIYTTHSVGCLPEDLGNGAKLIFPDMNKLERSSITKYFWSNKNKRPGFTSLLFGMGASQLTFMPLHPSLFVEGVSDMLLLPTLFREAAQIDHLGFHIAPGIAELSKDHFPLLKNHASQVAFLVDNDRAGEEYRNKLIEVNICDSLIFSLPTEVLEDCICKDLYLEAANYQIKQWDDSISDTSLMKLEDIPDNNRPKSIEKWCKDNGLKNKPDKISVAYYLLELAHEERQEKLIKNGLENSFKDLYNQIKEVFDTNDYDCR
jgi:predicted ATP-dependent endonuclease of OLD family